MSTPPGPICPGCRRRMRLELVTSTSSERKVWRCPRWPVCDYLCSAHADGRPMGIPADQPTRAARARLHVVFDRLWTSGKMDRTQAYTFLAAVTDLPKDQAHISRFDAATCTALMDVLVHTFPWLSEAV